MRKGYIIKIPDFCQKESEAWQAIDTSVKETLQKAQDASQSKNNDVLTKQAIYVGISLGSQGSQALLEKAKAIQQSFSSHWLNAQRLASRNMGRELYMLREPLKLSKKEQEELLEELLNLKRPDAQQVIERTFESQEFLDNLFKELQAS